MEICVTSGDLISFTIYRTLSFYVFVPILIYFYCNGTRVKWCIQIFNTHFPGMFLWFSYLISIDVDLALLHIHWQCNLNFFFLSLHIVLQMCFLIQDLCEMDLTLLSQLSLHLGCYIPVTILK